MPDVRQLMHHDAIDHVRGVQHQPTGKTKAVSPAAASEPFARRCDFDAGRLYAHDGGIMRYAGRYFPLGALPEPLQPLRCEGFVLLTAQTGFLHTMLDPVGVLRDHAVNFFPRNVHGRTHHHFAFFVDLQ